MSRSDLRRSSRIQTMSKINYNNSPMMQDEDAIVSMDETSDDEQDDLTSAFTAKIDKDWQPLHPEKLSRIEKPRSTRRAARKVANGVKIFSPNTGLHASRVVSKTDNKKFYLSKKMNVAISSSETEED